MKTGIIYCYFNPINGKRYIGQTVNERSRRSAFKTRELYCTKRGNGGKLSKFDSARKKYGINSFVYTVLCRIQDDNEEILHSRLDDLEKYYIKKYDSFHNGYNSTEGGFSGKLSEETKARISESLKGRPMSELTYQKICLTGYHYSEESKRKISEKAKERYKDPTKHPMFGKHHTEESNRKNSESRKGKCMGAENGKSKPVQCFTKSGEFVNEFVCQGDACEWLGRDRRDNAQISKCCNGKAKTAHGYVWKFKE